MLEILQGDFCPDRTDALFDAVGKAVATGRRVYLVVPEQQTLLAEKEAAHRMPPSSALNFEVTNPSRLANGVFRTVGGIAGEYADGTAAALLMWRTLSESADSLSSAGRGPVSAGSVAKAMRAVNEMRSLGIDAAALKAAADSVAGMPGRLERKLRDLSVIMTGYRDRLKEKYSDASEDIDVLTEKIAEHPDLFSDAAFYFDGFTSFTEPQYRLLSVLTEISEVHVCLILPHGCEEAYEFAECRRTEKRLSGIAEDTGAELSRRPIGSHSVRHQGLLALSRVLFSGSGKPTEDELSDLGTCMKIVRTSNPHEEAAFLSSDIKARVTAGARYRDFAVVMRNTEDYLGFVDTSLAENGIPAFVSDKRDVTAFEAVKLIRAAYRCVSAHFSREDVIAYAKCALCGISRDECDDFELYTELWNVDHGRFLSEVRWNMNPNGISDRRPDGEEEYLDRINGIRQRLISPLQVLAMDSEGERTVRDHAKNLVRFLVKIGLEKSLEERAARLQRQGEGGLAEENLRLFDCILGVLEKLVFVLGDYKTDARTFTVILDLAFSTVDIGRIPAFADEVTVGSADMIRLPEKKYVYLLGVNEGEFPSMTVSESYFSDKEKQTLRELGMKTEPEGDVKLAREYFIFARAMLAGSDFLTLVYTDRNAAFGAVKPSQILSRIDGFFEKKDPVTGKTVTENPLRQTWSDLPVSERVYTPTVGADMLWECGDPTAAASLKTALSSTGEKDRVAIGAGKIENDALRLSEDGVRALYPGDISVTKSILDTYRKCPLQHFLQYSLKLGENKKAEFDASCVGTAVHYVLENFLRDLKEKGKDPADVTDDTRRAEVERLLREHLEKVDADGGAGRQIHYFDKLIRSTDAVVKSVCDDLAASDFRPQFFELKMEDGDQDLPEPLYVKAPGGTKISVYGTIDRVDVLEDGDRIFVRVVDYKTGNDTFSRKNLEEGKNLQMFLYLRAVTESERFKKKLGARDGQKVYPAGVMYMNTKVDCEVAGSPDKAEAVFLGAQKVSGMCNTDPAVFLATNPDKRVYRVTKSGAPHSQDVGKTFTNETWGEVCKLVEDSVSQFAVGMKSGDLRADPRKEGNAYPCAYCAYAPVCRNMKS